MSARVQPVSKAALAGFPDPRLPQFSIVNCPYCQDAREQMGARLPACLAHIPVVAGGLVTENGDTQ